MQPENQIVEKRSLGPLKKAVLAVAFVSGAWYFVQELVPPITQLAGGLLKEAPLEIQVGVAGSAALSAAGGLGGSIYWLLRKPTERRALAAHIRSVRGQKLFVVYGAGSGITGQTAEIESRNEADIPPNLVIFSHPPLGGVLEHGYIQAHGGTLIIMPVQAGLGSPEAADGAREQEGPNYHKAHDIIMRVLLEAENTVAEMILIHLGKGNTSKTVTSNWAPMRTTAVAGALPLRMVVVVSDASGPMPGTRETVTLAADEPRRRANGGLAECSTADALSDTLKTVIPAVVTISNGVVKGSGTVVDTNGLIITAAQVVDEHGENHVTFNDGTTADTQVIFTDTKADIALLSCAGISDAPIIKIKKADSGRPDAGEQVVAFGHSDTDSSESFPRAIASQVTGLVSIGEHTWVQTGAQQQPGFSGGPLVDSKGRLVGIINGPILGTKEAGSGIMALSIDDVTTIAKQGLAAR